jgi:hypothetical protein
LKINAVLTPLGAVVLLALCGPALALPATIVSDTSLFARPRIGATELTGLPNGTPVDLLRCEQMMWCLIDTGGHHGWVPMASLAFDALPVPGAPGSSGAGGDSGGAGPQGPTLVGGLVDLLGGQSSGPQLAKLPGITVATRSSPVKAADKAQLKTKPKYADDD